MKRENSEYLHNMKYIKSHRAGKQSLVLKERLRFQFCVCAILIAAVFAIAHIQQTKHIAENIKIAIREDMTNEQRTALMEKITAAIDGIKNKKSTTDAVNANTQQKSSYIKDSADDTNATQSGADSRNTDAGLNKKWIVPLKGVITSFFGERENPTSANESAQTHEGIDIAADENTGVYASCGGKAVFCGYSESYGNEIKIDSPDGYETIYAHLNSLKIKNGDTVKAGDLIAASGNTGDSTGAHLHFGVYKDGKAIDPMTFFDKNDFEN